MNYLYQHKDEHSDIIDFSGAKERSGKRRETRKQHRGESGKCHYCEKIIEKEEFAIRLEGKIWCSSPCYRKDKRSVDR